MGTRTNFYKNPAYGYAKQFKISSVLENLQAYRAASGEFIQSGSVSNVSVPHAESSEAVHATNRRLPAILEGGPLKKLQKRKFNKISQRFDGQHEAESNLFTTSSVLGVGEETEENDWREEREERAKRDKREDSESRGEGGERGEMEKGSAGGEEGEREEDGEEGGERDGDSCNVLGLSYSGDSEDDESGRQKETEENEQKSSKIVKSRVASEAEGRVAGGKERGEGGVGSEQRREDRGDRREEGTGEEQAVCEVKEGRASQRFPTPDEPVCVICGRFGEYICDQTDDDICSLQCKMENLEDKEKQKEVKKDISRPFRLPNPSEKVLRLPESKPEIWDPKKNCFVNRGSSLSTYRCWKCNFAGHFSEDCTRSYGLVSPSPSNPHQYQISLPKCEDGSSTLKMYSPEMRAMHRRCEQLGKDAARVTCVTCGGRSHLAVCLDCNNAYCDGKGHLSRHMLHQPYHATFYSYKLRKQVKCCKPDCPESDIYSLYSCQHCLSSAFDKHYNMFNATWSSAGLKRIINAICCEDHFQWHRVNCPNADGGEASLIVTRRGAHLQGLTFSEFIF